MKNFKYFFTILFFLYSSIVEASERWFLDKKLSTIEFEVPVLFASNVKGEFRNIDGFVEIDLKNQENNTSKNALEGCGFCGRAR